MKHYFFSTALNILLFVFVLISSGCQTFAINEKNQTKNTFKQQFEIADNSSGAMFRWWWPGAAVDHKIIKSQLEEVAKAGYKGVEIADVKVSVGYPVDPEKFGYGSSAWREAIDVATQEAERLNLQIDITMGPHWPVAVPGLDVNGPASAKELIGAFIIVKGNSYQGTAPLPKQLKYSNRSSVQGKISEQQLVSTPSLVSLSAVRCKTKICDTAAPELDLSSVVDLNSVVKNGFIDWNAPIDWSAPIDSNVAVDSKAPADDNSLGHWVIVAHWQRGTAQRNDAPWGTTPYLVSDPESRVVDHFSPKGAQAFLNYFETTISKESLAAIARVGGAFFEDSIELKAAQLWTPAMLKEFETRRGYSLKPYLACATYHPANGPFDKPKAIFHFPQKDQITCKKIRRDLAQTVADLYFDYHLLPMQRWANKRGINYRAQPYGIPIDMAKAAAILNVAEDESFASGTTDDWKLIASGVESAGKTLVSNEFIAGGFGGTYRMSTQRIVEESNTQYALGANQLIFHGLAYDEWPPAINKADTDSLVRWPGYRSFMVKIPDAFGPRNPGWKLENIIANYLSRTQKVLQSGHRQRDLAIYNQSLSHIKNPFTNEQLKNYSYGYISPGLLEQVKPKVRDKSLYPNGPAFKAVILDKQKNLALSAAKSLLAIAKAGVPVIIIGKAPEELSGFAIQSEKEIFSQVIKELESLSIKVANKGSELKTTLEKLNIRPVASFSEAQAKILYRKDKNINYFYIHNQSKQKSSGKLQLCTKGVPFYFDAWQGKITRLANYKIENACTALDLSLHKAEAKIIAMAPPEAFGGELITSSLPARSQGIEEFSVKDSKLIARQGSNRSEKIIFADGSTRSLKNKQLPKVKQLKNWRLQVDSFLPDDPEGKTIKTRRKLIKLGAVDLLPWNQISSIENASGIGTYTINVELDESWSGLVAYLSFKKIDGTFAVKINGQDLGPLNQLENRIDLGQRLRPGKNTIEITVASNLNNILRSLFPADYGKQPIQDYGLLGPVNLSAYRDIAL